MGIELDGLGNIYDIGTCWAPLDLNTADGATGKRISLMPGKCVAILASIAVAASGTDNVVLDVQQHTAYTGGTSNDMDSTNGAVGVDHYYVKSEALLDNDEAWARVTQSAASEITLTGATYAATEVQVWIPVYAGQLADGYTHISVACTAGNVARLSSAIYIVSSLRYPRRPDRLFNLLRPGAVNA